MELPPDTVLIFDRDEGLLIFESLTRAADWIEAIDIDEGEYTAGYSPDGSVDLDDLERRVTGYWHRHQTGRPPRDPLQTARFLMDRDNQPRRRWLGRVTDLLRRDRSGDE